MGLLVPQALHSWAAPINHQNGGCNYINTKEARGPLQLRRLSHHSQFWLPTTHTVEATPKAPAISTCSSARKLGAQCPTHLNESHRPAESSCKSVRRRCVLMELARCHTHGPFSAASQGLLAPGSSKLPASSVEQERLNFPEAQSHKGLRWPGSSDSHTLKCALKKRLWPRPAPTCKRCRLWRVAA